MPQKPEPTPQASLSEAIDTASARGGLSHLAATDLANLRQHVAETKIALANFYHDVPPSLADAITRAASAL